METTTNEKTKKTKLMYPAIPTCKSAITTDYVKDYLIANHIDATVAKEFAAIYDETVNANQGQSAAFVKASNAVIHRFCEIYFPNLLIKKEPKPKKPSFRDFLHNYKKG